MTKTKVNKKSRTVIIDKDRTTAILLAVFFSLFAWIYTWKFDKPKFWAALIANVFLWWTIVVPIVTYAWVIIDMIIKDQDKFDNYSKWKVK